MGAIGIAVILHRPHLLTQPALALAGFAVIASTSVVQFAAPQPRWLSVEEALSALAGVLIMGLGPQRVSVLAVLWLVAIASGVLARGGRVHWLGRDIVLVALALPILREGSVSGEYAALCVGTLALLLTSGRLTRELNHLLMQARLRADSAQTLLLAGDIAARMAERGQAAGDRGGGGAGDGLATPAATTRLSAAEQASAREALARVIAGEGLSMAVQPIVDLDSGRAHAYEALARFAAHNGSPLHWFELAQELGVRPALERACLRQALELHARRPPGTSLSVNLSAPVLLEADTLAMLDEAARRLPGALEGLIVEITEETLVHSDTQLLGAIEPLRALGAKLAVDDMGAGYSGLRQITGVRPGYLKLDRSLIAGINLDGERAALVGALVGYCKQVGCALVAEGVETAAELGAVERLGVPLVQGFYFSRPGAPWPQVGAGKRAGAGAGAGADAGEPRAEPAGTPLPETPDGQGQVGPAPAAPAAPEAPAPLGPLQTVA